MILKSRIEHEIDNSNPECRIVITIADRAILGPII
jgi:hypothetical protein